ncbi:hypothetical protein SAMN02744102_02197 [Paenibacillus barengoltzii]|nr:hypothetical protein SAMN02744102_02197 [Paenibacillus barengoltzii]
MFGAALCLVQLLGNRDLADDCIDKIKKRRNPFRWVAGKETTLDKE